MRIFSILIAVLFFFSGAIYVGVSDFFTSPPSTEEELSEYIEDVVDSAAFLTGFEESTRAEMMRILNANGFDTNAPGLDQALSYITQYTTPIYREEVSAKIQADLTTEELQTLWETDRDPSKRVDEALVRKVLRLAYQAGEAVGNRPDVQQVYHESLKKVYPDI